jgi:hypothetical protein
MSEMQLAILIKPLVMFVVAFFILYPCRKLVEKKMPDGKLKRLLLRRVN